MNRRFTVYAILVALIFTIGSFGWLEPSVPPDDSNLHFIGYGEFSQAYSSTSGSKKLEWVVFCHPCFEDRCYQSRQCVLLIKLSDKEGYVLVPERQLSAIMERLQVLQIPVVARS
jgi:hypothetical protein